MKQTYHKVSHALMTLLLLVSTFLPLLSSSPRVSAAELGESDYQLTTDVTINTNPLKDTGYGEGKFYIAPTYTFADSKVLNNGDTMVYRVPSQFKLSELWRKYKRTGWHCCCQVGDRSCYQYSDHYCHKC